MHGLNLVNFVHRSGFSRPREDIEEDDRVLLVLFVFDDIRREEHQATRQGLTNRSVVVLACVFYAQGYC